MRKAARSQARALKVTQSFEPNRLSDECLAHAYEIAFPIAQQDATGKRSKITKSRISSEHLHIERLVM